MTANAKDTNGNGAPYANGNGSGPSWKWVLGISGSVIALMLTALLYAGAQLYAFTNEGLNKEIVRNNILEHQMGGALTAIEALIREIDQLHERIMRLEGRVIGGAS